MNAALGEPLLLHNNTTESVSKHKPKQTPLTKSNLQKSFDMWLIQTTKKQVFYVLLKNILKIHE